MQKINSIEDVVSRQLCTGCGACAWAEPTRYQMRDVTAYGRRPIHVKNPVPSTGKGIKCCPGIELEHTYQASKLPIITELESSWGPVLEVHEGYATDEVVRKAGSSGGLASALSLFALEQMGVSGILQTKEDSDQPLFNVATFSRTRADIIASTGSRYSPASPCEALGEIETAPGKAVFVGKPCDVAALQKAVKQKPELAQKISFTVGFFCAGVPSTKGLYDLLHEVGAAPSRVTTLRFRGNGWPGNWVVQWRNAEGGLQAAERTYEHSWAFLQAYRQWRCHICPDHSGEFADIAVGDPWYKEVKPGEMGSSLIVVRTAKGQQILAAAISKGYIKLSRRSVPHILPQSQRNLIKTRGALWGRLIALRIGGIPTPRYKGFPTYVHWKNELSLLEKLQSIVGTFKRIWSKRLYRNIVVCDDKNTSSDGNSLI